MSLVNKQGRLLATEAEQKARWIVHFSEVQNRQPPTIEAEVQDPDTDLNVSTAPIRERQNHTNHQIPQKWKRRKTGLFKTEPEFAAQVLQPIFAAIWKEKQLPDNWPRGNRWTQL